MLVQRSLNRIGRAMLKRPTLIFLFCLSASLAKAHTIELRALLNPDGSATFYARTYHGTSELLSGGFIIDGVTYPFQGYIQAPNMPSGTQLISTCSYTFRNTDYYQWVTVPAFNSCVAHTFNCTSNSPETPLCNLTNTLMLGGPQITQQPAMASGGGCVGSTGTISVSVSGNNLTYQWQVDMGSGFVNINEAAPYSGTNTADLTITPVSADMSTYSYQCVVTGTDGCGNSSSVTSNPIALNPGFPPAITTQPSDIKLCGDISTASFTLAATGTAINYQWQVSMDKGNSWTNISGATSADLNLNNISIAQNGYLYRAMVNGSCAPPVATAAALLTVANPIPAFNVNKSTQCADANNFIFMNSSSVEGGFTMTYKWTFGDGNTSTAINPVHNYTVAGNYDVSLIVASNNGCTDSLKQSVRVAAMPEAAFAVNKQAQCFTGNQFAFTNNTTNPEQTDLTYQWSFGDGTSSANAQGEKTYEAPGYYTVVLTARNADGCQDTAMSVARIVADANGFILTPQTDVICGNAPVSLKASGGTSYQWHLNGEALAEGTLAEYKATTAGVYTVDVMNTFGCKNAGSNSITLSVVSKPEAAFSYTSYCEDKPVVFSNKSTGTGALEYTWTYGDGEANSVKASNHTYREPGTYNVQLVVSPKGCPALADTTTQSISIERVMPGMRLTTLNAVMNKPMQLEARSMNAVYQWKPAVGLNTTNTASPIATLKNEQVYTIDMTTAAGCTTTDTLSVRMFKNDDVFLPSGFTPDGDGNNDVFKVVMINAKQLVSFKIYNRWGNVIFETNSANQGWDGNWKGQKLPADSYLWSVQAIGADGATIRKTGTITLIR